MANISVLRVYRRTPSAKQKKIVVTKWVNLTFFLSIFSCHAPRPTLLDSPTYFYDNAKFTKYLTKTYSCPNKFIDLPQCAQLKRFYFPQRPHLLDPLDMSVLVVCVYFAYK